MSETWGHYKYLPVYAYEADATGGGYPYVTISMAIVYDLATIKGCDLSWTIINGYHLSQLPQMAVIYREIPQILVIYQNYHKWL